MTAASIDEYVFVLCVLHADTSTAHNVQTDMLQSAQNTRRGSRGWAGHVCRRGAVEPAADNAAVGAEAALSDAAADFLSP